MEVLLGTQEPFQSLAWLPKTFNLLPAPLAAAPQKRDDGKDFLAVPHHPQAKGKRDCDSHPLPKLTEGCKPCFGQRTQYNCSTTIMIRQTKERWSSIQQWDNRQWPTPPGCSAPEHLQTARSTETSRQHLHLPLEKGMTSLGHRTFPNLWEEAGSSCAGGNCCIPDVPNPADVEKGRLHKRKMLGPESLGQFHHE